MKRSNQKNYAYVYDICEQIADMYRNMLRSEEAVAEGDLVNFTWDIDWGNEKFSLLFNLPEYWKWVEDGRPPTTGQNPPWPTAIQDIKRWIEVKHLVPRPLSNGEVPDIEQQAHMIVNKIHKKGYKGRKPLEQALDKVNQLGLVDLLTDAVIKEFEMDIDSELLKQM